MLDNKVVVIIGGAGLIGRAFCQAVARENAKVIVADLNASEAKKVVQSIQLQNGLAEFQLLDITSKNSLQGLILNLHERYGRIDAIVNSAYPRNNNWGNTLDDVTYADFCENMNLHLGGYFLVMQQFASYFRGHGGGNMINIASIYGVIAPKFGVYSGTSMTMPVEYAAIKSSIIHLTQYFAQYFKSSGVRCNVLSPGGVLDEQPELFLNQYRSHCAKKGMLDAQDLCGSLIYLLSDASKFVTGHNLIVDDGFCL